VTIVAAAAAAAVPCNLSLIATARTTRPVTQHHRRTAAVTNPTVSPHLSDNSSKKVEKARRGFEFI